MTRNHFSQKLQLPNKLSHVKANKPQPLPPPPRPFPCMARGGGDWQYKFLLLFTLACLLLSFYCLFVHSLAVTFFILPEDNLLSLHSSLLAFRPEAEWKSSLDNDSAWCLTLSKGDVFDTLQTGLLSHKTNKNTVIVCPVTDNLGFLRKCTGGVWKAADLH